MGVSVVTLEDVEETMEEWEEVVASEVTLEEIEETMEELGGSGSFRGNPNVSLAMEDTVADQWRKRCA